MNYYIKIMPQAEQELEDIAYYIALDSPQRAQSFIESLVSSFINTLSVLPEGGVIHKGDIRKISYKHYTAFYIVKRAEKQVDILHIVNLNKPLSERGVFL